MENSESGANKMKVAITPYEREDIEGVIRFNKRLSAGGKKARFPESNISEWLPRASGRDIYIDFFLSKEGDKVRGGYILKHQRFFLKGKMLDLPFYGLPISEGIVNREYTTVGIQLLLDALKKHPVLFTLGMGGYSEPVAVMLKAAKWSMRSVPFYFKVLRPFCFLRKIKFLRRKTVSRVVLDFFAFTGIGVVGLHLLKFARDRQRFMKYAITYEQFDRFDGWADELCEKTKSSYFLIAVRDAQTLNILYPPSSSRFIKLLVKEEGRIIGWAVVLDTRMKNHKQFGDMRVGSIVDSLAFPENVSKVISTATSYLEKRGVDIIAANYLHSQWGTAFGKAGFLRGPSNFIFAASRDLAIRLSPFHENIGTVFMCRGDGDGPINL